MGELQNMRKEINNINREVKEAKKHLVEIRKLLKLYLTLAKKLGPESLDEAIPFFMKFQQKAEELRAHLKKARETILDSCKNS